MVGALEFSMAEEVKTTARLHRQRILVIEDDEDLAMGLQWRLSRGYHVATRRTALQGLHCYASNQPDLLIIDYQLPDADGIEFLQTIRASFADCAPALMISAYPAREADALRYGFESFVPKPICEAELFEAIRRSI
jgi:CheY-like chemotaxis protein